MTSKILLANKHLLQVLMPTMTADKNSWSSETCYPCPNLCLNLCRFASFVNRQVSLAGKLTSNIQLKHSNSCDILQKFRQSISSWIVLIISLYILSNIKIITYSS